jgi:phage tail-like protein
MATKIGKPVKYHKKFKFVVEIDDFGSSSWQKCSELAAEIAKIEQWQGGKITADKSAGRVTFPDITLERGATESEDCYNWFLSTANAASNSGLADGDYQKNGSVVQQDRDNKTLRRWNVTNAFPVKFSAGDWDNTADENVMESLTLTYDFFQLKKA